MKTARKRRRVRRNVDGFIGKDGRFHPIRASSGYSPYFEARRKGLKASAAAARGRSRRRKK